MIRARLAVTFLAAGSIAGPAGAYIAFGLGAGLLAASVVLTVIGLVLGWDA